MWDAAQGRLLAHERRLIVPSFDVVQTARLDIHTPLRLQDNGRPVDAQALAPRRLVTAAARRASLLFELHAALASLATPRRSWRARSD